MEKQDEGLVWVGKKCISIYRPPIMWIIGNKSGEFQERLKVSQLEAKQYFNFLNVSCRYKVYNNRPPIMWIVGKGEFW